MTVSKLATETWPLGKTPSGANRYYRRPSKPQGVIVHHAAGTSDAGLKSQYVSRSRELSSNYAMKANGDIVAILHEEYRPFTSSSAKADNWGITIEMVNQTAGPEWRGSDRQLHQLARLIADFATRWDFPINRSTVIGHREVRAKFGQGIATACPGPWWWSRMDELVALARKYQAEAARPTPPKPAPAPAPTPPPAKSPEQIEEDAMSAAAEDIKEAVRRENRPRLIQLAGTDECILIKTPAGFVKRLTLAEAEKRAGGPDQLLTVQELQRHPVVDRATFEAIIAEANEQLVRIGAAAAAALKG